MWLIDLSSQVYFWTTIRKNRSKYNLTRGISEEDVTSILLRDVVVGKDSQKAEAALLELPGLRKYVNQLRTEREKEDFRRHMRKYINMWLPDCPFEVSTTNRYTIVTHEAATTARRPIKRNDTIKYLCGNLVAMTPQEEKDLDLTRRDFSIVMSSRKKTPSLFLGPARFANHDCNANARLVTRGSEGMQVVAVRDIEVSQEITVNYGDNYFGEDNCECLCSTCEAEGRGGWPGDGKSGLSSGLSTPLDYSDVDLTAIESSRRSKRRGTVSNTYLSAKDANAEGGTPRKKTKLDVEQSPSTLGVGIANGQLLPESAKSSKSGSPLRNEILDVKDILVSSKVGKTYSGQELSLKEAGQHSRTTDYQDELLASIRAAFAGVRSNKRKQKSHRADEASRDRKNHESTGDLNTSYKFSSPFSFLRGYDRAKPPRRNKQNFLRARTIYSPLSSRKRSIQTSPLSSVISSGSPSEKDSTFDDNLQQEVSSPATTSSATADIITDFKSSPIAESSLSSSALSSPFSSLTSVADPEDFNPELAPVLAPVRKRGRPRKYPIATPSVILRKKEPSAKPIVRTPKKVQGVLPTIELDIPYSRTPGDYIRTHLLLGESFSRWVDCRTCSTCWVQANGYQTRKECPRCERHSKLYGYQWPKTEKWGKGDGEERVMDHRTVHRFLRPEEEAMERKKGRGVVRLADGESEGAESTTEDVLSERTDSRVRKGGRMTRGVCSTA